jgi:hypothetical protein
VNTQVNTGLRVVEHNGARFSWRVHGARVQKSAPERVGRGAIRFARRLRVDGDRAQAHVVDGGVTNPS